MPSTHRKAKQSSIRERRRILLTRPPAAAAARESAWGRGGRGPGRSGGRGRARRLLLRRGWRRGRRAPSARAPPRPGAPLGARAGSGSRGGGQRVREQRATNRRRLWGPGGGGGGDYRVSAAAARMPRGECLRRPPPGHPVSDRWSPGPRGRRAHVRTHTGAHTGDSGSLLPRAARRKALPPWSSVFGTTPDPWQAPSYWPTDLSFLVQIPSPGPDLAAARCSFLTNLAAKTSLIPRCLFYLFLYAEVGA